MSFWAHPSKPYWILCVVLLGLAIYAQSTFVTVNQLSRQWMTVNSPLQHTPTPSCWNSRINVIRIISPLNLSLSWVCNFFSRSDWLCSGGGGYVNLRQERPQHKNVLPGPTTLFTVKVCCLLHRPAAMVTVTWIFLLTFATPSLISFCTLLDSVHTPCYVRPSERTKKYCMCYVYEDIHRRKMQYNDMYDFMAWSNWQRRNLTQ
jgi:hypothetical protein